MKRRTNPGRSKTIYFYDYALEALKKAEELGKNLNEICSNAIVAEMKNNTYDLQKHIDKKNELEAETKYLEMLIEAEKDARKNEVLIESTFDSMWPNVYQTLTTIIKNTGAMNFEDAILTLRSSLYRDMVTKYAHALKMTEEEFLQKVRQKCVIEKLILEEGGEKDE